MFISDIEVKNKRALKTSLTYTGISAFCGLFSAVYEHFSHGIYSDYMVYLFLFPLLGGALPFIIIKLFKSLYFPGRLAFNLYNTGITTLTIGSCFKGALEIYGTTSYFTVYYWIIGSLFTASGFILYIASLFKIKDKLNKKGQENS